MPSPHFEPRVIDLTNGIVLPENQQMLGLLRKMGWIHHAKLSGGVYDISFDLPDLT